MRLSTCASHQKRAFTLVELLVVIGIIALLVSILLPSLNAARKEAKLVKCLANLHSIGEAIAMYTGQSKGTLPYGYWNGAVPVTAAPDPTRATDWAILLSSTLGKGNGSYVTQNGSDNSRFQGMFTCPEAQFEPLSTGTRKLHYTAHPRLMPDLSNSDGYRGWTTTLRPYKVGSIRRSSEIALIFDGAQVQSFDWNCNATATNLDNNGLWFSSISPGAKSWNFFVSGAGMDLSQPIWIPNGDSPSAPALAYNIRFRHGRNDTANILFVDGHCGSFRLRQNQNADAKMANFYVDTP